MVLDIHGHMNVDVMDKLLSATKVRPSKRDLGASRKRCWTRDGLLHTFAYTRKT